MTPNGPPPTNGPSSDGPCHIDLDPQGFFNVRVQYSHCADIASGSGLPISDVMNVVEEDNLEREKTFSARQADSDLEDQEDQVDYSLSDEDMEADPDELLF